MPYIVRIKNGRRSTYQSREYLKQEGFMFRKKSEKNKYWEKVVDGEDETKNWTDYAKRQGFCIECIAQEFTRSSSYRDEFFKHYKPFIGNLYFCIYCGRLIPADKLTVDHIIPVSGAEKYKYIQKKLKRKKWDGVNDYRNLGACCRKCNLEKGAKLHGWAFRGFAGKSNAFQVIRWVLRLALCVLFIYVLHFIFKVA